MPGKMTKRQIAIIVTAKDVAKHTTSFANETALAVAAYEAAMTFYDDLTDGEVILFVSAFSAEHMRIVALPTGTTAALQPTLQFVEKPINVFGDAHRYDVRVLDTEDGDPIFFITEFFSDSRYPDITHERAIKLTRASLKHIHHFSKHGNWQTLPQWIEQQNTRSTSHDDTKQ